jgi:hypothetical protein
VSVVTLLCEEAWIADVTRVVQDQGYRLSTARSLGELSEEVARAPDLAIVVADPDGIALVGEMDRHGLRYWLLSIGVVPPAFALRLPRKPHAVVPSTEGMDRAYLERLLDDWHERDIPRIDCFHFSYRHGVPPTADWVLDVRFLESPYWVPRLRGLESDSPEVAQFVTDQPSAARLLRQFTSMLTDVLPDFVRQNRTALRVGVGCTGGEHRSHAMVAALVASINATGCATARRLADPPAFLSRQSDPDGRLADIDLNGRRSAALDAAYLDEGRR